MTEGDRLSLTQIHAQDSAITRALVHAALDGTHMPPGHTNDVLAKNGYIDGDSGTLFPATKEYVLENAHELF